MQQLVGRADDAAWLRHGKTPATYRPAARRAAVSRTFLYENLDAGALIGDAITMSAGLRGQAAGDSAAGQEAWWERALNAEGALKAACAEIRIQGACIGQLLGQLRDTERELTHDVIQRTAVATRGN